MISLSVFSVSSVFITSSASSFSSDIYIFVYL